MSKVVFLDRDGTINIDTEHWWKKEEWQFTDRAPEALKLLKEAGFALAVVTNQGAIELGLYTAAEVEALHQYMQELLTKEGVQIGAIAYCPHVTATNCDCRKPKTGMAKQIEGQVGPIDYAQSWMIGDKPADMMFGKNIGVQTALIRSGYWHDDDLPARPDIIVKSLYEASLAIRKNPDA